MSARTTRLLLDVTWDPAVEDKPTTWQWNHGIDPRPAHLPIVVVGEVTGRDDELLTVLEELLRAIDAEMDVPTWPSVRLSYQRATRGLNRARRIVQDAINEHTPEPPDLDGEDLFPARPVSHGDRLTDLALEATDD